MDPGVQSGAGVCGKGAVPGIVPLVWLFNNLSNIRTYSYIHAYMHTYIHTYVYTYIHPDRPYICMYVCMHVCMYVNIDVCTIQLVVCAHVHTFVYMYIRMLKHKERNTSTCPFPDVLHRVDGVRADCHGTVASKCTGPLAYEIPPKP